MALEALIARWGLAAIFVGAGIEGEAVVLTGGILAHDGLLPIWGVAIAAAAGACLVDQAWFWTARHFDDARWIRRAKRRPAFQRALRLIEHHLILFTLGFRFVYGMRTVTPIAISASRIRTRTFVVLNIVSAVIWGPVMAWLGYGFGKALAPWMHGSKSIAILIGSLAAVAILFAVALRRRSSRPAKPAG